MADLQNNFKNIINDIESNIKNKEDLDYIKTQICNISALFLDELDKLADLNMNRIDTLITKYKDIDERIQKVERSVNHIEKDIYVKDEAYDFEITCPYCEYVFNVDFEDGVKKEVKCPECDNTIELDWNEEEQSHCCGGCSECSLDCFGENDIEYEPDELDYYDDDDDM